MNNTKRMNRLLAAAVFFGSLVLYLVTAARHPGWVDAAWILTSARNLELGIWANVHNLFNLAGFLWLRLFSGSDPHYALTLLCSLFGSLTVLLMYLAGVELTENPVASALGSVALTLSLSLWWHSTTIEVYTLNTVLIAAFFLCILRAYREKKAAWLYPAFFAGGLGISNHVLMALFILAFFAVLLPLAARTFRLGASRILLLIAFYILGASFYGVLFILHWAAVYRTMDQGGLGILVKSISETFTYAMGGPFLTSMFSSGMETGEKLFWRGNYLFLILLNFPSAAIAFIVSGIPELWRKRSFRTVILFYFTGLAAQVIWSANYFIWDMYAFALPVYVMLGLPLFAGIDRFLRKRKNIWSIALLSLSFLVPVVLYPSFARWPNRENTVDRYMAMYPEAERTGGIWDPAEYIFNPVKRNYRGTVVFCEGVMDILPTGAVYWDDESKGAYPLKYYYQEIEGRRKDVDINRIFGLIMTDEEAEEHARLMLGQLRRGKRVFLAGIVEPEREILNRLYLNLSRTASPEEIRAMGIAQFRETFPDYEIVDVPLTENGQVRIYEIRKRRQ